MRGIRAAATKLAARPLLRSFVLVCEATRALLGSIVGRYLSWTLLVCAPVTVGVDSIYPFPFAYLRLFLPAVSSLQQCPYSSDFISLRV